MVNMDLENCLMLYYVLVCLILTVFIEDLIMLLRMTHFCRCVVWTLWSMSSQVDDVDLLREAGGAPACTA